MSERLKDRLFGVALVGCAGATLLALVGLVWAVDQADRELLQWWALLATVGLPIAGMLGWLLGRSKALDQLRGLDVGIDRVMRAAGQTAALRVHAARAYKAPAAPVTPDPQQVVIIPAPTPYLGNGDGDDVLLLE